MAYESFPFCSRSTSGKAVGVADAELLNEYSYSKTLLNGRVRALSDEWDPGHAVEFGAAAAMGS